MSKNNNYRGNKKPRNNYHKGNQNGGQGRNPRNDSRDCRADGGQPNGTSSTGTSVPTPDAPNPYTKVGTNHPMWRSNNPHIESIVADIPMWRPTGSHIPFFDYKTLGSIAPNNSMTADVIPGIMGLEVLHGPGIASSINDPINKALTQLLTIVSRKAGRNTKYDAPDLGLFILACNEVTMAIKHAERIFSIANVYNGDNYYLPDGFLKLFRIDMQDLIDNRATYVSKFNNILVSMERLITIDSIPLCERARWVYSNIYTDTDTANAQFYVFVPAGFRTLDHTTGSLVFKPYDDIVGGSFEKPGKLGNLLDYIDEMISQILNDTNYLFMMQDVTRTFPTAVFSATDFTGRETITPVFDPMVLTEIENADVLHVQVHASQADIKQFATGDARPVLRYELNDLGAITPYNYKEQYNLSCENMVLNFHSVPTTNDVMYATALKVNAQSIDTADAAPLGPADGCSSHGMGAKVTACGSEVITRMFLVTNQIVGRGTDEEHVQTFVDTMPCIGVDFTSTTTGTIDYETLDRLTLFDAFNRHPRLPVGVWTHSSSTDKYNYYPIGYVYDYDIVNAISSTTVLQDIQNYAMQSLWGYPFRMPTND